MGVSASHEKLRSNFSGVQNTDSRNQIIASLSKPKLIDPVSNVAALTFQQLLKLLFVGINAIELTNILYVSSGVRLNFEGFGIQKGGERRQVVNGTHGAEMELNLRCEGRRTSCRLALFL